MEPTHSAPSASRAPWTWALASLTILAGILRFATLDRQSFWSDEAITVVLLRMDLGEMLRTVSETESTPPVYYVLAWAWTRIFGDGEVGLRSLSALAGTVTVPVAYAAGRELFGRRVAISAAALVAVSPPLVWYSQEARSYALAVLLCAASFAAFGRALRSPTPLVLAVWTATSLLALGTHYFAIFVVGTEAIWLLATLRSSAILGATLALGAGGLALLPLALTQHGHGFVENVAAGDGQGLRLVVVVKQLLVGESLPYDRAIAAAVTLVLVSSFVVLAPRTGRRARRSVAIAGSVGIAPILAPLVLSVGGLGYLNARNALLGFVPMAVAVAGGISVARPQIAGALVVGAVSCALLAITVVIAADPAHHRPNWRGLARDIREGGPAQVAVVTPDHQGWFARVPLQLYLPETQAVDEAYADAVPQFARVSRRPIDRGTPPHVLARAVVLAGVGWELPSLAERLPAAFVQVEDRRAHGYRVVRYESEEAVRLDTSSLAARQAAILLLPAAEP